MAYDIYSKAGTDEAISDAISAIPAPDLSGYATVESVEDLVATKGALPAADSAAPLGPELVTVAGWTLGAGWSGSTASGFTHTAGSVEALTWGALQAGRYVVTFTLNTTLSTTPELGLKIADAASAYLYAGKPSGATYSVGFATTTTGAVAFTPLTGYAGTISGVSVRAVSSTAAPALTIAATDGTALEARVGTLARESLHLGVQAGQYDVAGTENTALGFRALGQNLTGYWNTAVGWGALRSNTNGSRNVAVGEKALASNTTGYRNVAIGQSVLVLNKTGQGNIAMGADSMLYNDSGNKNISIGLSALGANSAGSSNIAIGEYAMNGAETSENIGIGYYALYGSKAVGNTAVGSQAGRYGTTAAQTTALGASSMLYNATGAGNTALGYEAGRGSGPSVANFNRLVAVGRSAARRLNTGSDDNTAVGYSALGVADGGVRNTAVGVSAGASGTGQTVNRNVLIGYNAGIALQTGGDQNTILGTSAGATITTGHDNILIGYGVNPPAATSVSRLNIGSTIYGDLATDHVGIGVEAMTAVLHLKAGTSAAGTAPIKLTAGTLLTAPEAGAIEWDGTDLYITTAAGARKKVTAA